MDTSGSAELDRGLGTEMLVTRLESKGDRAHAAVTERAGCLPSVPTQSPARPADITLHRLVRSAAAEDAAEWKWPHANAKGSVRTLAWPRPASARGEGGAPSVADAVGPPPDESLRLSSGVTDAISIRMFRRFGPRV